MFGILLIIGFLLNIMLTSVVHSYNEDVCFDFLEAGDYERAIQLGEELISKNPRNYYAHFCLTRGYFEIGDFIKSLEHARRMKEFAKNNKELALAYNRLGAAYQRLGEHKLAMMYLNRELTIEKELKEKRGEDTAFTRTTPMFVDKKDFKKDPELHEQFLKEKEDPKYRALVLNNMGILYSKLGDYQKSLKYLKEALEIAEREEDHKAIGQTMLNLGDTYRKMREFREAEKYLSEGLKIMQKTEDKFGEARGNFYYGYYYLDRALYDKALESFYRAYSIERKFGYNSFDTLLGITVLLELRPELRVNLERLSNSDQKLFEVIEKIKKNPEVKELLAKYQKDKNSKKRQDSKKDKNQASSCKKLK